MILNDLKYSKGSAFFVSYSGGTRFAGGQILKSIQVIFDSDATTTTVPLIEPRSLLGMSKAVQYPRIGICKTILKKSLFGSDRELGSCLLFSDVVVSVTHKIFFKAVFGFSGNSSSVELKLGEISCDVEGSSIQDDLAYEIRVVREEDRLILGLVQTEKKLLKEKMSLLEVSSERVVYSQ